LRSQWAHIATTYDSTTKTTRIYIDRALKGEVVRQALVPPTSQSPEVTIGLGWGGSSCGFTGILDKIKIYNYPLTPEKIIEHARLYL